MTGIPRVSYRSRGRGTAGFRCHAVTSWFFLRSLEPMWTRQPCRIPPFHRTIRRGSCDILRPHSRLRCKPPAPGTLIWSTTSPERAHRKRQLSLYGDNASVLSRSTKRVQATFTDWSETLAKPAVVTPGRRELSHRVSIAGFRITCSPPEAAARWFRSKRMVF